MRWKSVVHDDRGSTAIEFAMTLPIFVMVIFGILEFCLILFTKIALQHGVEMAARCASLEICANAGEVMKFAADQSYGLNPPSSVFSVKTASCGSEVSATYTYNFVSNIAGGPSVTLNARSCFPIQS